jgi:hypothetical protein
MSIDKMEIGVAERLPGYRTDPAEHRSVDIYMEKARQRFPTNMDGTPEQLDWIVSEVKRDLYENGALRHLEGKKRGYYGWSKIMGNAEATAMWEKRDADRIADAKRRAHMKHEEGWVGEPRQKLVDASDIAYNADGQPMYGSAKHHPPFRYPWGRY